MSNQIESIESTLKNVNFKYTDIILYEVFNAFKTTNIVLPQNGIINIYHHEGIENYRRTGATFINVVNREYCVSYVVMLPNQKYPLHYHKIKNESFYVLYGKLCVNINDMYYNIEPGTFINIDRGVDHSFWCGEEHLVIFEEISTTYMKNDSVYLDDKIASYPYSKRKTVIEPNVWREKYKLWNQLNHFN